VLPTVPKKTTNTTAPSSADNINSTTGSHTYTSAQADDLIHTTSDSESGTSAQNMSTGSPINGDMVASRLGSTDRDSYDANETCVNINMSTDEGDDSEGSITNEDI
jgi:hypothetical protein